MDEQLINRTLAGLPLGGLRFFNRTGSTNDEALAWAEAGAPDLAFVYAESQSAGHGRGQRRWFSISGTALTFSLVLRPTPEEQLFMTRFPVLGALSVCDAAAAHGFHPEIKWPNDVLLNRRKVCGILAESAWKGEVVDSVVLGIGLNVTTGGIPPAVELEFPATSLEAEAIAQGLQPVDRIIDRLALLRKIIQGLIHWRYLLTTDIFHHALQDHLAFLGEQVEISGGGRKSITGQLDGVEKDGGLRLRLPDEKFTTVQSGEVHLRPVL